MRQWARAGGWHAHDKRVVAARKAAAHRALHAQQAALKRYRTKGTLSGDVPLTYEPEEYIRLDLTSGKEPERKRRKRAAARARATKRRRWHAAAAEAELRGRARQEGDSVGAYPIECILDVRLAPGAARMIEAFVRWEGVRWVGHDSWEPLMNLTRDLRQQAELEAARRFPPGPPVLRTMSRAGRRAAISAALVGRRLHRATGERVRSVRVADEAGGREMEEAGPARVERVLDEEPSRNVRRRKARRGRTRISESDGESE